MRGKYKRIIQGGPKVGIELFNYLYTDVTFNSKNYLSMPHDVAVSQFRTRANFTELFFEQDGAPPHYTSMVRD